MSKIRSAKGNPKFKLSGSKLIPNAGLSIVGSILKKIGFIDAIDRFMSPLKQYLDSDIIKVMLAIISTGKIDYEGIREFYDNPDYYCEALDIDQLPSEATLRQRLEVMSYGYGADLENQLICQSIEVLKAYNIEPTANEYGYVVIDIDVSPFINEKCSKERVGRTYKGKDGYAPMFAYIGEEGYLLNCELRPGKQHCQRNTPDFLRRCIELARELTDKPLLFRLDSGNDASENVGIFMEESLHGNNVYFIVKRNKRAEDIYKWFNILSPVCTNITTPREGKTCYLGQTFMDVHYTVPASENASGQIEKCVGIRTIYDMTSRTIDSRGQYCMPAQLELDMYWCSIDLPDEIVIKLYHQHGTMEQFHSEIKSDMDCEQFPSGKYAVNSLLLHIVQLAYNILRMMGQKALSWWQKKRAKHKVKRQRIKSVIQHYIYAPAKLTNHAGKRTLDLGGTNVYRYDIIWLARVFSPELSS